MNVRGETKIDCQILGQHSACTLLCELRVALQRRCAGGRIDATTLTSSPPLGLSLLFVGRSLPPEAWVSIDVHIYLSETSSL